MNLEPVFNIEAVYAALSEVKNAILISNPVRNSFMQLKDQLETNPYGYHDQVQTFAENGTDLSQHLSNILNELKIAVNLCSTIINGKTQQLKTHLDEWKLRQKWAGNGYAHFDLEELNNMRLWRDDFIEIARITLNYISDTKSILEILNSCFRQTNIADQIRILTSLFSKSLASLINEAFVIVKQPPQVMKTNTKFQAELRSLVGTKLLENGNFSQVDVKAVIINENEANLFITKGIIPQKEIGEILENTGKMEYDHISNELSVMLRNMQLKKVKRSEKRGSESVVDEKFWILFIGKFTVVGGINIIASTISLPVTVIVHGNQEPRAWATITWVNQFSSFGREPFSTPDKVSLDLVMETLNTKFTSLTKKSLSANDIKYMRDKLIESRFLNDSMQLSWSKFCKENLERRNFTFWDWFYAIMKLIAERLANLWKDGKIIGFISKSEAERLLHPCCVGTFLLRFSDSELGCISTAFVSVDEFGNKIVRMVKPYTSNELGILSLANRLYHAQELLYLYPNTPKDEVFREYYTATDSHLSVTDPYTPRSLREVIRAPGASLDLPPIPRIAESGYSGPNTPASISLSHSPSETMSVYGDQHSFNHANEEFVDQNMEDQETSILFNTIISLGMGINDDDAATNVRLE